MFNFYFIVYFIFCFHCCVEFGCHKKMIQCSNTPYYNIDLDITRSCCDFQVSQRSYRKMTIKWSFSYNSFVKLSFSGFAQA